MLESHIIYRKILVKVPKFDGESIYLPEFMRACYEAREMVPPSAKRDFTEISSGLLEKFM